MATPARKAKIKKQSYYIYGNWGGNVMCPEMIGQRFLETLDRLEPTNPSMRNWLLMDWRDVKAIPMAVAKTNLMTLVERGAYTDDDETPDPRHGYKMFARGAPIQSEFGSSQSVDVDVSAGSEWDNGVSVELGGSRSPPDMATVTHATYGDILKVLASIWPCPWLEAKLFAPDFSPSVPVDLSTIGLPYKPKPPSPDFNYPWILYLSASLAADLKPPSELICEPTPGGGLILSATVERLDRNNPDHLRRSSMLRAIKARTLGPQDGRNDQPPRLGPY